MILKVKPKTRLDLLQPKKGSHIMFKQSKDMVKPPLFVPGERVLVGNLGSYTEEKNKEGIIEKHVSSVTYLVKVEDKLMYRGKGGIIG